MLYPLDHKMLKPGLRTRLIFIQVRVQPILASPSSSSSSETLFFRVQVRVRSLDTCAVFVGRHDINKTVKDMQLLRKTLTNAAVMQLLRKTLMQLLRKTQSQFTRLDQQQIFYDKFLIVKFFPSELELKKFYSSSSSSSEKLFF